MPELPEVETIKNKVYDYVIGQHFINVIVLDEFIIKTPDLSAMNHLVGQRIEELERRGKYLIFQLSSTQSVIMHFRMTGVLLVNPEKSTKYDRAIFHLSNGVKLVFSDKRRLGAIYFVENADTIVGKLGIEPMAVAFTSNEFFRLLQKHRVPIKTALLNQRIIAGIGNMYADEALFEAGIHPLTPANRLSNIKTADLYNTIRNVLSEAIKNMGASVNTFYHPDGSQGSAQLFFKVAHRKGQSCPICGTEIKRLMLHNRGSYFCPSCQPRQD